MKDGDTLILKLYIKHIDMQSMHICIKEAILNRLKKIAGQTVVYNASGDTLGWFCVRKKDGIKTAIKGYEIAKIMEAE